MSAGFSWPILTGTKRELYCVVCCTNVGSSESDVRHHWKTTHYTRNVQKKVDGEKKKINVLKGSPGPFCGHTLGCVWCGKCLVVVYRVMTPDQSRVLDGVKTWSLIRPGHESSPRSVSPNIPFYLIYIIYTVEVSLYHWRDYWVSFCHGLHGTVGTVSYTHVGSMLHVVSVICLV